MALLELIMTGITAIILFVFGLDNFSREIEQISGERFRNFLSSATNVPILGGAYWRASDDGGSI